MNENTPYREQTKVYHPRYVPRVSEEPANRTPPYTPNPLYDGKPSVRKAASLSPFQRKILLIALGLFCLILLKNKEKKTEPDTYVKTKWDDSPINPTLYNAKPEVKKRSLFSDIEGIKNELKRIADQSDRLATAASKKTENRRGDRGINTLKMLDTTTNLVFAGSFEHKENAEEVLSKLKAFGYKNAEIIMKEGLPYLTVVAEYYAQQKNAKSDAQTLERKGVDTYVAKKHLEDIYRKK